MDWFQAMHQVPQVVLPQVRKPNPVPGVQDGHAETLSVWSRLGVATGSCGIRGCFFGNPAGFLR